ncbi:putative pre-mRNA-splicing regulator WTAP [Paratrimastix pyriformis]|uniref:Pre-mRNA-splicing regulator WTAP n=1 Tax=Paratrimastix pyriformis TaxID=342808 RepID=A0ABQ8UKT6_9EUKA|nr:putative pre-mRNA-splicing regulator WTAP [Paratrimastix pyriformis]
MQPSWEEAFPGKAPGDVLDELAHLRTENAELHEREEAYLMRITMREQEYHDLEVCDLFSARVCVDRTQLQVDELRQQSINPVPRMGGLLDPAVNKEFIRLQQELASVRLQLKKAQEELDAVRFIPSSAWGKRLVAKLKILQDENEEFGRVLSEGTTHWLEAELSREKQTADALRQSFHESQESVTQLNEEIDGMQDLIHHLKQQLHRYDPAAAALHSTPKPCARTPPTIPSKPVQLLDLPGVPESFTMGDLGRIIQQALTQAAQIAATTGSAHGQPPAPAPAPATAPGPVAIPNNAPPPAQLKKEESVARPLSPAAAAIAVEADQVGRKHGREEGLTSVSGADRSETAEPPPSPPHAADNLAGAGSGSALHASEEETRGGGEGGDESSGEGDEGSGEGEGPHGGESEGQKGDGGAAMPLEPSEP